MTTECKPITIHYRKFKRATTVSKTLEQLVRSAMNHKLPGNIRVKDRYLDRLHSVNTDNFFINTYVDGAGETPLVFGDILHFTKGHLQALCHTSDTNAASVEVRQMRAPAQNEYVHSQMFWMIKSDHVFVVQSMSLRTAEFELYLDWLLKDKTKQLSPDYEIILDSRFDETAIGGNLNDIQEIIVGSVVSRPSTIPDKATNEQLSEVMQRKQIDAGRKIERSTAWAILEQLLGSEARVSSLMDAVPLEADLNVQVHIGYQTKKRKISRLALRQLETGLRNLPDSQLQVKAKGTNVAADGTIRLHHNASIRLIKTQDGDSQIISTLLDPYDVLRATVEAYSSFIANGKIKG
jgi:hypothetical protein